VLVVGNMRGHKTDFVAELHLREWREFATEILSQDALHGLPTMLIEHFSRTTLNDGPRQQPRKTIRSQLCVHDETIPALDSQMVTPVGSNAIMATDRVNQWIQSIHEGESGRTTAQLLKQWPEVKKNFDRLEESTKSYPCGKWKATFEERLQTAVSQVKSLRLRLSILLQ
jgi:hypothetical protein